MGVGVVEMGGPCIRSKANRVLATIPKAGEDVTILPSGRDGACLGWARGSHGGRLLFMSKVTAEAGEIKSVSDAIEALTAGGLLRDLRPGATAKRGDDSFGLWFRGHEKTVYSLTPGILRESLGQTKRYVDEMSLVRHFKALNPAAAPEQSSDFDWLVTMQHYLAPTRLLDWTENLLVALYFAVRNAQLDGEEDAAVWFLNARRLNYYASATSRVQELAAPTDPDVVARSILARVRAKLEWRDVFVREMRLLRTDRPDYKAERIVKALVATRLDGSEVNDLLKSKRDLKGFTGSAGTRESPLNIFTQEAYGATEGLYARLRMPVAVYPHRTNSRIRNQSGVFTLHGGKHVPNPEAYVAGKTYETPVGLPIGLTEIDAGCGRKRILKWLRIPRRHRADIRKTLSLIGVTEAALFPELDYQSKYLLSRWTHRAEPENGDETGG